MTLPIKAAEIVPAEKSPLPSRATIALAVLAEFGGGIALVLGFLTPLAAFLIAGTMTVALAKVHLPHGDPFVGAPGKPSFEPAAGYLAQMIMFLLVGPGVLSVDALLFGKKKLSSTAST